MARPAKRACAAYRLFYRRAEYTECGHVTPQVNCGYALFRLFVDVANKQKAALAGDFL